MHLITIYDGPSDSQGIVINSPYPGGEKCQYKIHQVLEGVSDMEFILNPSSSGWGHIKPLRTLIKAINIKTGELAFSGRILKPKQSMSQNGMFSINYVCESKTAYLNDSVQRYGMYQNVTVKSFLTTILNNHNSQVEPHKQFKIGDVTVTDPNDSIFRYLGYENTYESIKDKLIDRLGGYLRVREGPDGTYLDYLKTVGEVNNTPIKLRVNLKSLQREIDPTEIITRLVVLGAKVSDEANNNERLTFSSVNNGKDYLDNTALISEFGIVVGTLVYDDINTPSTLLLRANQFFASQSASRNAFSVSAVDLSKIDSNYNEFKVGDWYQLEAGPLAISEPLQIIGKTMTHDNPQVDTLDIGDKHKSLSAYQNELNKKMQSFDDIRQQVEGQAITIRNLNNKLADAQVSLDNIQTSLLDVDIENLPAELQDISLQLSGLQSTLSDIEQAIDNVPVYGPASSTKDGLLTSELYMKLQSIQLATESIDGLLVKEDKQKLNKITVNQSIDLDQFMADFLALKDQVENM
ncbi:phage tail spike protein [Jeotgalibaca porci]|uniref:phage tail spike protein n=1 Tax=Jeotgalibaca porci TaxID=1868793 RepID=UPI0035A02164